MIDPDKPIHTFHKDGRNYVIQHHPRWDEIVRVFEQGLELTRMTCDPDQPLSASEANLRAHIEREPLLTPEEATAMEPYEDDLWHPSMGKKLPNGALELAITVDCSRSYTDHGAYWGIDEAWWTGTSDDLGFGGISLGGEPSQEIDAIADQLISFLGEDLVEGQSYVLALRLNTGGGSQIHFTYSRKHWPPLDL